MIGGGGVSKMSAAAAARRRRRTALLDTNTISEDCSYFLRHGVRVQYRAAWQQE